MAEEGNQDPFQALVAPISVLDLVRLAVRWCHQHGVEERPLAPSGSDGMVWLRARRQLEDALDFSEMHPAQLRDRERARLLQALEDARAAGVPVGAIAYFLLKALDPLEGCPVARAFEAERREELLPGEVVAVVPATHLKELFGKDQPLSAQGHSRGRGLSGFRSFAVLPHLEPPYRVALRFTGEAAMAELLRRKRIAVLLPNRLRWEEEFLVEKDDVRSCFSNMRPKDPQAQRTLIEDALARADAAGATVAILPELSVDSSARAWLPGWLKHNARNIRLLVAGSFHPAPGESGKFNRCVVYDSSGAEVAVHHKFNRYCLGELEEELETTLVLNVIWAGGRPFSVMICKDVLDAGAQHILQELRLHWLYVPALSGKTDPFQAGLPNIAQTITVVANYPGTPDPEPHAAIAALPLRRTPLVTASLPARTPGVFLLQFDDFPLRWQLMS